MTLSEKDLKAALQINCGYFMDKYHIDNKKIRIGILHKNEFARHFQEFNIDIASYKENFENKEITHALIAINIANEGNGDMLIGFLDKLGLYCILFWLEKWYDARPDFFKTALVH